MKKQQGLSVIRQNAAGIDIASKMHYVAVRPDCCEQPIRSFGTFTRDLYELRDWLLTCKVDSVAMEATGIYWVSLFLILEEAGLEVLLVNARTAKNVSGRKTDVKDAEWLRQLHSYGLLSASFQPDGFTRKLRSYMRHRKNLLEMAATHIRMMQKAMEQMNIKLTNVIADITGKSGQAIIRAILNGERDPQALVQLLDGRIKRSREEIALSLQGIWKEEHVFELRQSFELYHTYRQKVVECDEQIRRHVATKVTCTIAVASMPTKSRSNKNNLHFEAESVLKDLTGTDLTTVFGITATNALQILSETGTDMNKWPTVKHFTSWLNLAPNNKTTGGKVINTRITPKNNKAGQIFRMAAFAIQRSDNWLAHFYKRIKSRHGAAKAITATARKLAVIFYKLIKDRVAFQPITSEAYFEAFKQRQLQRLERQAKALGLSLKPI